MIKALRLCPLLQVGRGTWTPWCRMQCAASSLCLDSLAWTEELDLSTETRTSLFSKGRGLALSFIGPCDLNRWTSFKTTELYCPTKGTTTCTLRKWRYSLWLQWGCPGDCRKKHPHGISVDITWGRRAGMHGAPMRLVWFTRKLSHLGVKWGFNDTTSSDPLSSQQLILPRDSICQSCVGQSWIVVLTF